MSKSGRGVREMKRMQRLSKGFLVACASAVLLAGCGKAADPGGERPAGNDARTAAADDARPASAPRARRDCPPQLSAAAERGQGPVDDVVGIRPGMPWDDVVAILECRGDLRTFQTAETWSIRQNYGFPTRQLLRATDGVVCSEAEQRQAQQAGCDTAGNRFEGVKEISEEFVVLFTGMPGEEIAQGVWRRTVFPADGYPANSALVEALTEKYGSPLIQASEMNHYNAAPRRGAALNLAWVYDTQGRMFALNDAVGFRRDCTNGMKPWFAAAHSWNSGCGLTVRAEIMAVEGSRLMASSMDVMVINQAGLFNSSRAFEQALATAYEAKAKENGRSPDL